MHKTGRLLPHPGRVLLASLAVLALVAAGCGDDDADDASTPETTSEAESDNNAEQPEATGDPIRLGALIDMTGPSSGAQATTADVAEAWAEELNANSGIDGHPVELDIRDTRGDAPTATAEAEELIGDETIAAVLVVDSAGEAAIGETLSNAPLPVVGGAGYNPTVWGALPYWYGISTSFPNVVNEQVVAAEEVGASVVAGAPCAEIPACSQAAPIFEAAADTLGLQYEGQIEIAADAPDYTAECLEFIDRGADYIQLSLSDAVATRLAGDCALQGYEGWFGASAGNVQPGLYGNDIRLSGGLNGFPWFVDAPPVEEYRRIMEDAGLDRTAWGHPSATAVYASLELFATTISDNAETLSDDALTRDEVIEAYGTIVDETLDGLLPQPITFSADDPAPAVTCFWLYTAEGGSLDGDFEPECGEDYGF